MGAATRLVVLGLLSSLVASCSITTSELIASKGYGTARTYPLTPDQAWKIVRAIDTTAALALEERPDAFPRALSDKQFHRAFVQRVVDKEMPELLAALNAYPGGDPPLRRAKLTVCRRAGLVGRMSHDFRRTAVRNLAQSLCGWPGTSTEMIYRYAMRSPSSLQ